MRFLPAIGRELKKLGWDKLDIILTIMIDLTRPLIGKPLPGRFEVYFNYTIIIS